MERESIVSVPHLMARAHGRACVGPHRCLWCGAPAADAYRLPDSFTALDTLAAPGSEHICVGCRLATTATAGQAPEGKPWMWSWVLATGPPRVQRLAACLMLGGDRVRADRSGLRTACLDPPPPPSAVIVARAGRTHTLYRAAIWRGGPQRIATLDGRPIGYDRATLVARIDLCVRIAGAVGPKTARDVLVIPPGRWPEVREPDLDAWHSLRDDPLTHLAACLFDDLP